MGFFYICLMLKNKELYQYYLQSAGVTTDTRQIQPGSLFFALKGEHFDGNKFATDALEKGASYAIIDNEEEHKGERYFLVEDVLSSLQDLARYHRNQLRIPVIALTGTNGKTTTKELIHRVFLKKFNSSATIGNLNNHIGVPLSILAIKQDTEIAVIEMGANHPGEIAELCSIARPSHGMITNIGKAHLQGFGGYAGVVKAKSELYDHLRQNEGMAFVNFNDPLLMKLASGIQMKTYGSSQKADFHAEISSSLPYLSLQWNEHLIHSRLYGDYNFENILAALCIGDHFGIAAVDMADAIAEYTPSNNRSQLVKSNSNLIYLDAYNANPSSMEVSIAHFKKQKAEKKVLILGDMLELGEESEKEHKAIADMIRDTFDLVILVGPEFMKVAAKEIPTFIDTEDAAAWLRDHPIKNAHILMKGSRGIAIEKLLELL
jgi:UDP-N-acetylmuramoyl-tripeptide--D-alanyl-D-alanine ligase